MSKPSVLLLGGTGALGVYLAPELAKLGYEVHITSRKEHQSESENIKYILGNAKDDEFLKPLVENHHYDVIVDFMIYNTPTFKERYDWLVTKTTHYIFTSSYRVYGDNGSAPITEESPRLLDSVKDEEYLATDEYGLTKARQENILRESEYKNWTIIRPAITYSTTRFQLGTLEAADFVYRAINNKPIIFPKQMLNKQATLSWAGDVAKMIAALVLNENAYGETYTVSTSEHHTWGEILEIYKKLINLKVVLVDLSVYQEIIGGPYQIKYDRMLNRIVDNSKILELTGMKQSDCMKLEDGLKMELQKFVKDPKFGPINQKRQSMMDDATKKKQSKFVRFCKKVVRRLRK